jgi:hydrogenase/urease accessory protein HupE
MTRCHRCTIAVAACLWVLGAAAVTRAHPLDPALLEIRESAGATLDVLWRLPLAVTSDVPFEPLLPDGCTPLAAPDISVSGPRATLRWRVRCGTPTLVGQRIGVVGLRERQTDALLRVHLADGRLIQAVLRGDAPVATIPERAGPLDVLRGYLRMGFEHILSGPDHLLFVLGLVLLVHGRRRLLWTITAFTAGHSVTLSLAVLGFVHIPPNPVEALIAFTIFVVAVELTRQAQGARGWMQRFPWAMAFTFGLLHGLGFAGALAAVGLPAGDVPLALFSFNAGIELGQLLFVALILTARVVLRALPISVPKPVEQLPAYAIGSCAMLWLFERVVAIF